MPNQNPDPAPILDLIEAFRRSKTMFTAVSLGVFDALSEMQSAAVGDLARRTGANTDALERLLDACVGLGLLRKQGASYSNTAVADRYLASASPETMAGYVRYSNDILYPMWGQLESAVHEGAHQWRRTFGCEGSIFDHFYKTEPEMRTFVMGMHGFGRLSSPAVVAAFDLSAFGRLADLGGATGHLTIAACEAYPNLHGTVFDLPKVIAIAREQVALSPARDRIECVEGDFFRDPLPRADLYAVGRILHDWSAEKIDVLLRKILEALPGDGALLIAEKLLDGDKSGPVPAQMQSLNMLLVTEGKERTLGEYREILQRAGFTKVEAHRTGQPLDAILARK